MKTLSEISILSLLKLKIARKLAVIIQKSLRSGSQLKVILRRRKMWKNYLLFLRKFKICLIKYRLFTCNCFTLKITILNKQSRDPHLERELEVPSVTLVPMIFSFNTPMKITLLLKSLKLVKENIK